MSEIMVVLILIMMLYFIVRGKKHDTRWSIDNTMAIRGALAFLIAFGHMSGGYMYGNYPYPWLLKQLRWAFQDTGFLYVGAFFMFGAYGCRKGVISKEGYLKTFMEKRTVAIFLPFIICDMAWCISRKCLYNNISWKAIFMNFFDVNVFPMQWYVISVMVFYIVFYCIYSSFDIKKSDNILIGCSLLYIVYCYLAVVNEVYYVSHIGIVIGILWNKYEDSIEKKIMAFIALMIAFLFVFTYPYLIWAQGYSIALLDIGPVYRVISVTLFCTMLGYMIRIIDFSNFKVLNFFGGISYEIYLVHPCAIWIIDGCVKYRLPESLGTSSIWGISIILTMAITIFSAMLLKKVTKVIRLEVTNKEKGQLT